MKMNKLFEVIINMVIEIAQKKFFEFLSKVFTEENKAYFDIIKNYSNEYIFNVEKIAKLVKDSSEEAVKIIEKIKERYGIEITEKDIEKLIEEKGMGKLNLAFKLTKARLEELGIEINESLIITSIQNGVERFKTENKI